MSKATLILAAGGSKRLKQPKQLLNWNGKSLIRNCIHQYHCFTPSIFIVTGGYREAIIKDIKNENIKEIYNENWEEGIGSSIRKGVRYIMKNHTEITQIMITLCDTPLISDDHISLLWKNSNDKKIVISSFQNSKGVPAVFDQYYFKDLSLLKGDLGAKKIIKNTSSEVIEVKSNQLFFDIDTAKDYQRLLEQQV